MSILLQIETQEDETRRPTSSQAQKNQERRVVADPYSLFNVSKEKNDICKALSYWWFIWLEQHVTIIAISCISLNI